MSLTSSPANGPAVRFQNISQARASDISALDFKKPQVVSSQFTAGSSPLSAVSHQATSGSSIAAQELNKAALPRDARQEESEAQRQTRPNTRPSSSYGSGGSAPHDDCCLCCVCCGGPGGGGGGGSADCGEAGPYVCLGVAALTVGVVATGAIAGGASYGGALVVQEYTDNKLGRAGGGAISGAGTTAICAQIAKAIAIGTGNPGAAGLAYGVAWGVGLLSSACGIGLQLQEPPRHPVPLESVVIHGADQAAAHSLRNDELPR